MKKKITRMLLAIMLAATVQIQPNQVFTITPTPKILATQTTDNQEDIAEEESTSNTASPKETTKNQVKSQCDPTDGNTDVNWPKGPSENSLTSSSAVLMDADTGLILYNKNMTDKHYPASITKIMTTLLAIENCSPDDTVTFTSDEVLNLESGASNIDTQVGEKLTIEQCLYAIMLASANEVCNGVADFISGDTTSFGELMTARANALGCVNTNFTNPNGLHSDDHYTCAYDMALISQEALKNETFRKVANTSSTYLDRTNKYKARSLTNHHNMINAYSTSAFLYEDCIGGKTGYTSAAQSTLVTFAKRDGMTLICVVMEGGSSKTNINSNIYTDTISLLEFGFDNYEAHQLSNDIPNTTDKAESPFFTVFDSILDFDISPLQTSNNGTVILPVGVSTSDATRNVVFYDKGENPEEHAIGTVTYEYGNKTVGTTTIYFNPDTLQNNLTTSDDIEYTKKTYVASKTKTTATTIRRIGIIVCFVFVVIALFAYFYFLYQKKRMSRRRYTKRRRK